jgi:hypothetical protein
LVLLVWFLLGTEHTSTSIEPNAGGNNEHDVT